MASSIANEIAAKVSSLPLEKQRKVLQIVESLVESTVQEPAPQPQRRNLLGSLEHLNIKLTAEDIQAVRREMWGEYMREDSE
ncbi:MAG: hypothetical protein H0U81_06775 [Pyrinomonadaceae bacterium]|nr:hypothetical protein [Pyrinomonadaceae bacterium]